MTRRDLTGRWDGIFNYPAELPPNGFIAVLAERGGTICGEIEEVSERGEPFAATIEGERIGSSVRFVKHYRSGRSHPVSYAGTLSPEGDEITGEWMIPGIWSGSFIMVRPAGRSEPLAREVSEEVR